MPGKDKRVLEQDVFSWLIDSNYKGNGYFQIKVLFQIVLCKAMRPDFNHEEVASVKKDKIDLSNAIREMAEYLPLEDPDKGKEKNLEVTMIPHFDPKDPEARKKAMRDFREQLKGRTTRQVKLLKK